MAYLSSQTHAAIRADPHGYFPRLYEQVRPAFLRDLPPLFAELPEDMIKLAFASTMAFDLKPYGPESGQDLGECLAASSLNCADYCVLAIELYRLIASSDAAEPAMVGWNGGAVGNHAQILHSTGGKHLLADPTIGLLAMDVTLSGLCRGHPPTWDAWTSFWASNGPQRQDIASFDATVKDAVLTGKYMAEHLLYYFPSLDAFRNQGATRHWATPQSGKIL